LAVELCEREGPGILEQRVEVVDAVEDGDYVEECGEESDNVLCEDGFGDVNAGLGDFFGEVRDAVTKIYQ
jgi:hypothetical protein